MQERNRELYVARDRSKSKYVVEKARLDLLEANYVEQSTPMPDQDELLTIGALWKQGTTAQRWAVLSSLFERGEMRNGKIMGFKPRADRVARVRFLIDMALVGFHMNQLTTMFGISSGSGKGGLRTRSSIYLRSLSLDGVWTFRAKLFVVPLSAGSQ
jgi:hypothetical protein